MDEKTTNKKNTFTHRKARAHTPIATYIQTHRHKYTQTIIWNKWINKWIKWMHHSSRAKYETTMNSQTHTMFHNNFISLFPKQRTYRNHPDAIQKKTLQIIVVRWVDLDFNLNEDKHVHTDIDTQAQSHQSICYIHEKKLWLLSLFTLRLTHTNKRIVYTKIHILYIYIFIFNKCKGM